MAATAVKAGPLSDVVVTGSLANAGEDTLYEFQDFHGYLAIDFATKAAAKLRVSITHDDGVTWTVVKSVAAAVDADATTNFTFLVNINEYIPPARCRVTLLDKSGATNGYRGFITFHRLGEEG